MRFAKILFEPSEKNLIKKLKKEHKVLLSLCVKIETNFQKQKFGKTVKLLKKLKINFEEHIKSENEFLYPYLKSKYKDIRIISFIEQKRKEIFKIKIIFEKFINEYKNANSIKKKTFKEDFDMINFILIRRIKFEETKLYSYY